ncbi:hypothetical protein BASA81_002110 [Batrachochytrium salamandrivorans]|nr:hypothetical protein BASA81_002110 [Batrachochytrium salamandrivorans]
MGLIGQAIGLLVGLVFPQAVRNEQRANAPAGVDPKKEAVLNERERRHAVVEQFLQRRGRLIQCIPLIMMLAVANTNMLAAVWTSFAVSLFINLADYYRTRYNPDAYFPMVLNMSSLCSYIAVVIIFYVRPTFDLRRYVGGIIISFMFLGVLLSLLVGFPMTLQTTSIKVQPPVRGSWPFTLFNIYLTLCVLFGMACMLVCVWCSILFEEGSAGQIVLGIVLPLVLAVGLALILPVVGPYLRPQALIQLQQEQKQKEQQNNPTTELEHQ